MSAPNFLNFAAFLWKLFLMSYFPTAQKIWAQSQILEQHQRNLGNHPVANGLIVKIRLG